MKAFLIAAFASLAFAATGIAPVKADTFTIHGFDGTHYGR